MIVDSGNYGGTLEGSIDAVDLDGAIEQRPRVVVSIAANCKLEIVHCGVSPG
jgi:hypothetical protein